MWLGYTLYQTRYRLISVVIFVRAKNTVVLPFPVDPNFCIQLSTQHAFFPSVFMFFFYRSCKLWYDFLSLLSAFVYFDLLLFFNSVRNHFRVLFCRNNVSYVAILSQKCTDIHQHIQWTKLLNYRLSFRKNLSCISRNSTKIEKNRS